MTGRRAPLTVLHLRSSPFLGSPERMLLGQLGALDRTECTFLIGVLDEQNGTNDFAAQVSRTGTPAFVLEGAALRLHAAMRRLSSLIAAHRVDVLCTHDYKANLLGVLTGRRAGVPVIAVYHGRTSHDWKVRLYEAIDARVLTHCARVVAVSEQTRRVLESAGIRAERIRVIANAVDVRPGPAGDQPSIRCDLGLGPATPVVLYTGRLSPEKGLHILLQAMRRVADAVPGARLLILGQGPEEVSLRARIRAERLEEHVHLLGFKRDVQPFLRACDVFVLPSFTEGMPVSVLEAFAWDRPVVATRVGGVPEIVEHGVSGLLVEPGDDVGLADAVVALLSDRPRALRMGKAGGCRVREQHGFARQTAEYVTLFREVSTSWRWNGY